MDVTYRGITEGLKAYRAQMKDVTVIQTETVRRLLENDATPAMEMAAILEDIGNKFLDMSEGFRNFELSRQEAETRPATWIPTEDDPA